jgi:apolipoprotein N-acyltransferase
MHLTDDWSRVNHSILVRYPLLLDVLALVAGYLMVLGFAPYQLWPLTSICFGVLIDTISRSECSMRRAVLRGYLFGLGMFGFETSWVYISLHYFGGASVIAGLGLSALAASFYALFPMLATLLMVTLVRTRSLLVLALIWPAIWILVEWLRAWFVFGFPWLQIGSSLLDSPLAGYIPLIGSYGSGWIAAATAGLMVGLLRSERSITNKKIIGALIMIAVVWASGQLLKAKQWTTQLGEPFTVALLQGNIAQELKWDPQKKAKIIRNYVEMTEQHWDADLIVWPETAVPAYFDQMQDFYQQLAERGKLHQTDLLIGTLFADAVTKRYYNAVVIPGEHVQMYRKRHLVPFGEYLPFQPISGWVAQFLDMPMANFHAGPDDQALLKAVGMPLVTTICYEDSYPAENLSGLPEAAYIVNVSNDSWFADSIAPHQHLQYSRIRSLEAGRYTLRATNNGVTAIIDPAGKIIHQIDQFKTAVLKAQVHGMQGATPYVRIGDTPVLLTLLGLVVIGGGWSVKQNLSLALE